MNNFYEGQVQLIDRLVEFALENMRVCGRSSLGIEDFAFGFGQSWGVISGEAGFTHDLNRLQDKPGPAFLCRNEFTDQRTWVASFRIRILD